MGDRRRRRRLSAVIAADVAGYTRLVEQDADGTVAAWQAARADIIDPTIAEYSGRIVKHTGDGFLAEFVTVQDAVACAVAMQEGLAAGPLDFRMGTNLGDIIDDGEDIHGEGVNIAARIEALAEPGGICVSGSVYEQVRNHADHGFEDLGEHTVKHVSAPVRVYAIRPPGAAGLAPAKPVDPDKPSVAVLPFANMSDDPDMEYFVDGIAEDIITALSKVSAMPSTKYSMSGSSDMLANGIAEDIITALSKVSAMRVIARNSILAYRGQSPDVGTVAKAFGVGYVLEGSIRRAGNRLRISAQLVQADTGNPLWAERFDRVVDDVFDIQDQITKEIVTALRVQLTDGEEALMWARGTNDVEAWQSCVRATELFLGFHSSEFLVSRALAKRAVERDPSYAHAWAVLGFTYWWDGRLSFTGTPEAKYTQAKKLADLAASFDDTGSWVIGLQAMVSSAFRLYDEAIAVAEQGTTHHPGNAEVRAFLASALSFADRAEEALEHIQSAMALNPMSPSWYLTILSRSLMTLERFDEALAPIDRLLSIVPQHVQALLMHTVILDRLGRDQEARRALQEARKTVAPLRVHHLRNLFHIRSDKTLALYTDALLKAGLPE